jgi:hypothetical protein
MYEDGTGQLLPLYRYVESLAWIHKPAFRTVFKAACRPSFISSSTERSFSPYKLFMTIGMPEKASV